METVGWLVVIEKDGDCWLVGWLVGWLVVIVEDGYCWLVGVLDGWAFRYLRPTCLFSSRLPSVLLFLLLGLPAVQQLLAVLAVRPPRADGAGVVVLFADPSRRHLRAAGQLAHLRMDQLACRISVKVATHAAVLTLDVGGRHHLHRVAVIVNDDIHEGLDGVLAVPAVDLKLVVGRSILIGCIAGAQKLLIGGEVVRLLGVQAEVLAVDLDLVLGVGEGLQGELVAAQVDLEMVLNEQPIRVQFDEVSANRRCVQFFFQPIRGVFNDASAN